LKRGTGRGGDVEKAEECLVSNKLPRKLLSVCPIERQREKERFIVSSLMELRHAVLPQPGARVCIKYGNYADRSSGWLTGKLSWETAPCMQNKWGFRSDIEGLP
jgi:hypothetical protein